MIRYIDNGDLFDAKVDALVNPVNCKGTMGKGIALEFKKRFPWLDAPYKAACASGKLAPGIPVLMPTELQQSLFPNQKQSVILFPTKNDWRSKSRLEWIDKGLSHLRSHYRQWGLRSIAMPQLGCGLGGLDWNLVRPLIEKYFRDEPLLVEVYLQTIYTYNEKVPPRKTKKQNSPRIGVTQKHPSNWR